MTIQDQLSKLGIELPAVAAPVAAYIPAIKSGNLIHVSGQLPKLKGEFVHIGSIPAQVSIEQGVACAQACFLNGLAAAAHAAGGLEQITRLIQINGFVNSPAGFEQHPAVINGASELALAILGENGKHARAAIGVSSLPFNVPVEISFIFECK